MSDEQKRPAFSRLEWIDRFSADRKLPGKVQNLLHQFNNHGWKGNGLLSLPRPELAEKIGRTERDVTRFLGDAREAGYLEVVSPGYRGNTAVWRMALPP